MSIDENGDRNADYSLLDMNPETGVFHVSSESYQGEITNLAGITFRSISKVGVILNPFGWFVQVVAHYSGRTKSIIDVEGTKIHWAGNRATWPPDTPKCGFDGTGCPSK